MDLGIRLLAGIVTFGLTFCTNAPKCWAVEFAPAKTYATGTSPTAVVLGDFNADGKLDIAVANNGSGNVSILLGNGDGTFQPAVNFEADPSPNWIVAGDFDGDQKLDLVVSGLSLSLYLGNGNGKFETAIHLSGGSGKLSASDINLDGKPDLISGVNLLLGNGDGTFQAPRGLGVSPQFIGDLNADGKPDLVAVNETSITTMLGNGDGTFQPSVVLPTPANTKYIFGLEAVGDFNGDQKLDLVLGGRKLLTPGCKEFCISVPVLGVYEGTGDGNFELGESVFFAGFGGVAADFNADGKSDLLFPFGNAFYCPCPAGSLLLGWTLESVPIKLPGKPFSGVASDLNSDGLPDAAFVDDENNVVLVLLNTSPTSGTDMGIVHAGASPDPVGAGLNLTYTAKVLNEGPHGANGVKFTDTLPNGVNFVSATASPGSCIESHGTVTCDIGSLESASGSSVAVVVTPTGAGTITNSMRVTATDRDLASDNNSATQNTTVQSAQRAYTLAVAVTGDGSGSVASNPAGISCASAGGSCLATQILPNTIYALTATPAEGSTFAGWSGACAGMDPNACTVTINSDQSVSAKFKLQPDFALKPSITNLIMKRGGQVSDVLTFPAQGGFSGTITLACSVSGPAPMPTCGISPASIKPGDTATLTINAPALAAAVTPPLPFGTVSRLYASLLPLGLMGCVLATAFDSKRRSLCTLCLLLLVATFFLAACGGGSSQTSPPPQNYTVTVTANSVALQHSTTISVTVN
jgi:uncharacterized repeat protein (TIGR01451 family)